MADYKSSQAGSGRKKGRGRENPSSSSIPSHPPLELWEAAGLEKAEGRKGSGGGLLFKLCVLRFQSQRTLIQPWLFISSQYPCRRRQAAVVFIIAYIMETLHERVCLLGVCLLVLFFFSLSAYRISPFGQRWVSFPGLCTVVCVLKQRCKQITILMLLNMYIGKMMFSILCSAFTSWGPY